MTYDFFPQRFSDAEARLLYVESPPRAEVPGDAPKNASEVFDAKNAVREAQKRMQNAGAQMQNLQKSLDQLRQFKTRIDKGEDVKADPTQHADIDADSSGSLSAEEVQAKITQTEEQLKAHTTTASEAQAEVDQHLSTIESSGTGGKLDATFMRLDTVMKNPSASMGEKFAAILTAFMDMQNLVKGVVSPALNTLGGGSTEGGNEARPKDVVSSVRDMMKDTGKTNLTDVRAVKQTEVTNRQTAVNALEASLGPKKTALTTAQTDLDTKKADLALAPEDPGKQAAVQAAEVTVATEQAAVQAIETQLQTAKDALAAAKEQVKTVDAAAKDIQDRLDTFNHGRQEVATHLFAMLDNGAVVPAGPQWNKLELVRSVLSNTVATKGASECDIALTIPNMHDFMIPFAEANVDAASLQVNADGSLKEPEAFLATIGQLIEAVRAEHKKEEDAGT